MMDELRFGFGKNWRQFIENNLTPERITIAQKCLLDFLGLDSLNQLSFLDIGCGSGIHSYAAWKAGAGKIVSFDYDIDSVNTTKLLWEQAGKPSNWEIYQGSILDESFISQYKGMDIIYSWGVLHHTGNMWQAIANTCELAGPKSLVYLALYTDDFLKEPGGFWLQKKYRYNHSSRFRKKLMELWYIWNYTIPENQRFKLVVFLKRIMNYKTSRGMSFYTDVKDWLGGWPMEFAKTKDTVKFCEDKFDLELINLSTGEANSEYLFKKCSGEAASQFAKADGERIVLNPPFNYVGGNCYSTDISHLKLQSDSVDSPRASQIDLYENNKLCLFKHSIHQRIIEIGEGSYSHWNNILYFSASNNSNPNVSGKCYSIKV